MTDLINERINDEAVYRTAPATPGLLKTKKKSERSRKCCCIFKATQ